MDKKGIKSLSQTDNKENKIVLEHLNQIGNTKECIKRVCKSLRYPNNEYVPSKTVDEIKKYLFTKNKLERILYSELTSYVFSIQDDSIGTLLSNAQSLIEYLTSEVDDSPEIVNIRKIAIKIYDHICLVNIQTDNIALIFAKEIAVEKNNLQDELKIIQREYITILGIFASIVLSFVGGMTFATSVFNNIHKASIYRLLFILFCIGFVFINAIYILVSFIYKINTNNTNQFSNSRNAIDLDCCNVKRDKFRLENLFFIDVVFLLILIFIFLSWFFKIDSSNFRNFSI